MGEQKKRVRVRYKSLSPGELFSDGRDTSLVFNKDETGHLFGNVIREPLGPDSLVWVDPEDHAAVKKATERIQKLTRKMAGDVVAIGRELAEVKRRIGHGNFSRWTNSEFGWDLRTAENYLNVFDRFKNENFSGLNVAPSALYLLAAPSTPEPAREEALNEARAGKVLSHKRAAEIRRAHIQPKVEQVPEAEFVKAEKVRPSKKSKRLERPDDRPAEDAEFEWFESPRRVVPSILDEEEAEDLEEREEELRDKFESMERDDPHRICIYLFNVSYNYNTVFKHRSKGEWPPFKSYTVKGLESVLDGIKSVRRFADRLEREVRECMPEEAETKVLEIKAEGEK